MAGEVHQGATTVVEEEIEGVVVEADGAGGVDEAEVLEVLYGLLVVRYPAHMDWLHKSALVCRGKGFRLFCVSCTNY